VIEEEEEFKHPNINFINVESFKDPDVSPNFNKNRRPTLKIETKNLFVPVIKSSVEE
jgi:hypothetical protein